MTTRTTEKTLTFTHPFNLQALVEPLEAGSYRLISNHELIEGFSIPAYRRVATHLEIPAISVATGKRQFLQVSHEEIYKALARDEALAG
jgi:hypothetical protein